MALAQATMADVFRRWPPPQGLNPKLPVGALIHDMSYLHLHTPCFIFWSRFAALALGHLLAKSWSLSDLPRLSGCPQCCAEPHDASSSSFSEKS